MMIEKREREGGNVRTIIKSRESELQRLKVGQFRSNDLIDMIQAKDQMTKFQTSALPTLNLPRPCVQRFPG